MLVLKKIAITGGLASGKSTVGALFKNLGAYLLDTDVVVHNLLEEPLIQNQVIELLGPRVKENNSLNRSKIAEIVFKDPNKLDLLEKILHPHVREEVEKKYKQITKKQKWNLFVVEIPLLFETESNNYYDYTIAVVSDLNACQKRFKERSGEDLNAFNLRSKRQLSQEEKAKRADFVIYNNGSLLELKETFQKIYTQIIQ